MRITESGLEPLDERLLDERLLDERQAAQLIGVRRATMRHWRATGSGPSFLKPGGRLVRYQVRSLRQWIASQLEKVEKAS